MQTRKKILLSFCVGSVLLLLSLAGIILYYYHHPSATRSLIEKSLSHSTGTSLSIKGLSYSLNPVKIRATDIIFKAIDDPLGFFLKIYDLKVDVAFKGPFGRRSLVVKALFIAPFRKNEIAGNFARGNKILFFQTGLEEDNGVFPF